LKQRLAAAPDAYDLIMPSDYVVDRLIKQDLLAPLNKARLPNLGYLTPIFFHSRYDRELVYSVPLFYSTLGVAFNSEYLRHIPRNFRLKSPIPEENLLLHGYRALLDEPRVSLTAALLDDGLGPNDATATALTKVTDRLIAETKELGLRFLADDLPKAIANNQITIAVCWSGAASVALARNSAVRFVLPDGANVVQVDSFVIPRTSPHQATAEFFLNFLLVPEISGALVNFSLYASTNVAARPFVNREILLGPAYIEPSPTSRVLFADLGQLEDEFDTQWQRLRQSLPPISAKVPLRQSRGQEAQQQDLSR
jgi:spermidine/putrescine transport system substrate-binding protein